MPTPRLPLCCCCILLPFFLCLLLSVYLLLLLLLLRLCCMLLLACCRHGVVGARGPRSGGSHHRRSGPQVHSTAHAGLVRFARPLIVGSQLRCTRCYEAPSLSLVVTHVLCTLARCLQMRAPRTWTALCECCYVYPSCRPRFWRPSYRRWCKVCPVRATTFIVWVLHVDARSEGHLHFVCGVWLTVLAAARVL